LVALSVPTSRDPNAGKSDWPGVLLSTAAMASLIYTIIEAPTQGWSSARTLTGFGLAAAVFAAFVARERTARAPMLDITLFRNPRFTASRGSVAIALFCLAAFIFLITQDFQFFKGYRPLSAGIHLLPVALSVGVMAVLGTKLAVRIGTKQIVTGGLLCLTAFFAWVSTASAGTSYLIIAAQMLLGGTGMGLVSAPATEAIMGVVPKAKAGVGSAVNDATRLLGTTPGVAAIGSAYAPLSSSRLSATPPSGLSPPLAGAAHNSVGAALEIGSRANQAGHPAFAASIHHAASTAFFHGLGIACLLAAGVSA